MSKFQPIKHEKTVISIRIEENKLRIIDNMATKTDVSRNDMICQCIDYAINNSDFKDLNKFLSEEENK